MTGAVGQRLDGKYEVVAELGRDGPETLYAVLPPSHAPDGRPLEDAGEGWRLGWFEAATPAARSSFHAYRHALRDLDPPGLADVVARPGAYYTLWRPLGGVPLAEFLAQPGRRDRETSHSARDLIAALSAQGYAAQDAEIVIEGGEALLARLAPRPRTPEEAEALNRPLLDRLLGGKLRRRRLQLGLGLFLVSVLPGLGLLAWAGLKGAEAARVYLNPPVADVPNVAGQPAAQAAETLSRAGFRVAFVDGENPAQDLGNVIGQNPAPGSSLHAGRLVTLTVNNPPPLTVPKLEELNLDQVKAALSENRLKLGAVTTVPGTLTNTPKGRVIAQLPEPGATAQRGQSVSLLVSGGVAAQQTWLPPLSGLSFEQARDLARRAGLVVNRVQTQDSDAPENTVLAQKPAPYEKVDVGSAVTLTLAKAPRSNPSRPVNSLPLAPPPAPPPVAPTPAPTPSELPGALPSATPGTSSASGSASPQEVPATPPDLSPRTVQLRYTFPSDLPEGTVEVLVRDADGERVVVGAQPSAALAGSVAEGPVPVRGDATFVVRVNGQDYATFKP